MENLPSKELGFWLVMSLRLSASIIRGEHHVKYSTISV